MFFAWYKEFWVVLALKCRAVDPDRAFQVNPDADTNPRFLWPKTEGKKYSRNFCSPF
jgi:hypothetical protein